MGKKFTANKFIFKQSKVFVMLLYLTVIYQGLSPVLYTHVYGNFLDNLVLFFTSETRIFELVLIFLPVLVLALANAIVSISHKYFLRRTSLNTNLALNDLVLNKTVKLHYENIESAETYELIERIKSGQSNLFTGFMAQIRVLILLGQILSLVYILLQIHWLLALVEIVVVVVILWLNKNRGSEDYEMFTKFQQYQNKLNAIEKIQTSKEYVNERNLYGYAKNLNDKYQDIFTEQEKYYMDYKRGFYIKVKVPSLLIDIATILLVAFLLFSGLFTSVGIGNFVAVFNQLLTVNSSVLWSLAGSLMQLSKLRLYVSDINEFLALPEEDQTPNNVITKIESIEFRDVYFAYPGSEQNVISDFSFKFVADKTYAIVGENGAGKSTLMKLLLALFENYSGQILVNGMELNTIANKNYLYKVLFQDFAKYEISVMDNINFAHSNRFTESETEAQLYKLGLDVTNENRFPAGLDTEIGYLSEHNTNLSGGEWQKIALLRSAAKLASFYILDEPTSALDPEAESQVYEDFMQVLEDYPGLIITHRLGAARLADEILVIEAGTLVEHGSHAELLEQAGIYNAMYQAQKGWYENA